MSDALPASSPSAEPPSQSAPPRETTSIDDHTLPKSVVVRLAKAVLPEHVMIQKEAVTALVKSATVFINYIASTANDITKEKGKKTINNEEVLEAVQNTDFDMMMPLLQAQIEQFEIARQEKRKKLEDHDEEVRKKRKVESDPSGDTFMDISGDEENHKEDDDEENADDPEEENYDEDDPDEEGDGGDEEEEDPAQEEEDPTQEDGDDAIDMAENEGLSDEEESDEALVEDSD